MFDAKKLLDSFLGSQGGQSGRSGGLGRAGQGAGGMLGDLAGSLGSPEGVKQKAGQAFEMAKQNPLAAGAIAALLLGSGAGRSIAGSAVKMGGLAAIASMAYKAYQDHQAGKQPEQIPADAEPQLLPPPSGTAFDPAAAPQGEDEFALTLVRAMIAAAKSDGHIDDEERRRIGEKLSVSGIDAEAEQFMLTELDRPTDLEGLVAAAKSEAQKVELYTASRLAIDSDTRAERGYLDLLAGRLQLPDTLVDHIEATVASVKV